MMDKSVHFGKGKPFFTQIFEGCSEMIEFFFIENQKSVMGFLQFKYFYFRVLAVMFFLIQIKL